MEVLLLYQIYSVLDRMVVDISIFYKQFQISRFPPPPTDHFIDVTWARWCHKSPATSLFVQQCVQASIKENIKACHHWPFMRGIYRAHFLSLAQSKLRPCSANGRPGYWSNLPCDWLSTAWCSPLTKGTRCRKWTLRYGLHWAHAP